MTWRSFGSAGESSFGRLDFRAKLAIMLASTVLAFLWESPMLNALLALLVLGLCLLARIQLSYLGRMLRLMVPFYLILLFTHGIWNTSVGRTVLWTAPQSWWMIGGAVQITLEGLMYGLMIIFRTLILVLVIPLVIFTTSLDELIVGLVRIRIPYKVAFVFSATLRFVPLLLQEIRTITDAQRLRGLALEKMNLPQRLRVYSRIAVPLLLGAMTKSQQLDVVLAARAFSGSSQRTYLHEFTMGAADYVVVVLCVLAVAAALVLRATAGVGAFHSPAW
jgi:energy-coupling factor transport system permease protein